MPTPIPSLLLMMERAVLAALLCQSKVQPTSRFERKHYHYADLPHGYQITQQRWPLAMGGHIRVESDDDDDHDDDDDGPGQQQHGAPRPSCRVERIQLEMDTAKTTTSTTTTTTSTTTTTTATTTTTTSRIDLDRAGVPLLEIVTKPDIRSPQQAAHVAQHLHALLARCQVTRGRLERGEYRVDVNVNVECLQSGRRSPRVEIKNLNSFAHVHDSIVYEAQRQAASEWQYLIEQEAALREEEEEGAKPDTRTWDAARHRTVRMRRKDAAHDYRFLPDPDLPPLQITSRFVDRVRARIPELPNAMRRRLVQQYGIPAYQARILVQETSMDAVVLLEDTCRHLLLATKKTSTKDEDDRVEPTPALSPKVATTVANLIANELFALVQVAAAAAASGSDQSFDSSNHENGADADESHAHSPSPVVEAWQLSEIASMLHEGVISLAIARKVLAALVQAAAAAKPTDGGAGGTTPSADAAAAVGSPRQLVQDMGWHLVGGRDELLAICRRVLRDHPKQAAEYAACETESTRAQGKKEAGKARRNQQRLVKLFMGKAMSASGGNAHPERLQEALQDALEEMVESTTTTIDRNE
jgi:aspartyl/glutamyl-tRNA(Asn/Gln) amidotransferase B subunit